VQTYERAWRHGICGDVMFRDCRVPAGSLLAGDAADLLSDIASPASVLRQAVNLGIGRAAFAAAVDYARLRVQGGRPIIEHQAIGQKLAGIAIKLDVARTAVWRAAWACDHPEAFADRSLPDLPLHLIAEAFTGPAMLEAAKDAAEVFGAMGVMRDLPMQKYVHDARIGRHGGTGNNRDAMLRIAETLAGYRRAASAAIAAE
jgi:alkylation response protein AidB-like acyl-CoA dehydrogenase